MILTLERFMKSYGLKNQTMKTSELLEKLYKIKISGVEIYPRDSIINSTKGICNIDNGSQGGTHWVAFEGSSYFDSF